MTHDETPGMGRRELLRAGGLTVTLAALVAACGESEAGEPGRVGYAPVPTALPTLEVNDAVYLRTATSIENTILDAYAEITASGALSARPQEMLDRLVEDHEAAVAATSALTIEAGGQPYGCANAWYMERVIAPIFARIDGDEAQDILPTDEPERDRLVVVNGLESMAAAMYQQMVELLTEPELRSEVMAIGATSARHAAAFAILITLAPDAYASPEVLGEEVTIDVEALLPVYAIAHLFGSLAAIPVTVGAPSEAGTRFSTILETPADNSYIYDGLTCDV